MLRIKRTAAILTAFLIMFCLTAQAEEAGKLIAAPEEAASFIETLLTDDPSALDGKYQLSAQMNLALKLSGGFEGLAKQLTSLGEIQEIGTPFETEFAGQTAFRIPCRFSAMPIDLVMLLQDGVIAGLVTAEYTDPDGEAAEEGDTACENIELALPVEGRCELPGTLSLPEGEGPFPVVVLIHGSGPNDRDETVGMLKPFRDLAEGLAEKGIAVYRFDKRSKVYGRELADDTQATLMDESIEDAVAAVQLMAGQDAIDASRIFVLGHSLGGCAIPAIDRELKTAETKAAGYILMAASPRKLWELMKEQMEYLYSLRPEVTEEELAEKDATIAQIEKLKDLDALPDTEAILGAYVPYWKWLRDYDILETARQITAPCLLLQGEEDYQATMEDYALWKEGLKGKENWTFKSYPGLVHAFVKGEKSEGADAYTRKAKVDDQVIADIAAFVG